MKYTIVETHTEKLPNNGGAITTTAGRAKNGYSIIEDNVILITSRSKKLLQRVIRELLAV